MTDDLLTRLRKVESSSISWDSWEVAMPTRGVKQITNWYRNPDGPEAAACIDALQKRVERLEEALALASPTMQFERKIHEAWSLLLRISETDWNDDPTELRRVLDGFVEEARMLTLPNKPRAAWSSQQDAAHHAVARSIPPEERK